MPLKTNKSLFKRIRTLKSFIKFHSLNKVILKQRSKYYKVNLYRKGN